MMKELKECFKAFMWMLTIVSIAFIMGIAFTAGVTHASRNFDWQYIVIQMDDGNGSDKL